MLVHGFAEHSGRYDEVAAGLTQIGFDVWRFDVRGHGRSEGARGHVYRFEDYLDDFDCVRDHVRSCAPSDGLPLMVLSHSNGGLICLHALARDPSGVAGAVFSSPFLGFALDVPWIKQFAGRRLSRLVPSLPMPTGIKAGIVSHDPAVIEAYASDPLNHGVATPRWLTETTRAHIEAPAKARLFKLPVLFQQAGDDRIASASTSQAIFDRLGSDDRTFTAYPGLFHEIWFELDRAKPLAELHGWLVERL